MGTEKQMPELDERFVRAVEKVAEDRCFCKDCGSGSEVFTADDFAERLAEALGDFKITRVTRGKGKRR